MRRGKFCRRQPSDCDRFSRATIFCSGYLLREDLFDFSRLAIIGTDLQRVLQLFFCHVEIVGFQIGHAEVIVIGGIVRTTLYLPLGLVGSLKYINRAMLNALLVVAPPELVAEFGESGMPLRPICASESATLTLP